MLSGETTGIFPGCTGDEDGIIPGTPIANMGFIIIIGLIIGFIMGGGMYGVGGGGIFPGAVPVVPAGTD